MDQKQEVNDLKSKRKNLLKRQTQLRDVMMGFDQHEAAVDLFLRQHAELHSRQMAKSAPWSFEDEILNDMSEPHFRRIPRNCEHSVAWCLWHIARVEDVTMNLLVAGTQQVFSMDSWHERLNVPIKDTGNVMSQVALEAFSDAVDLEALRAYRVAVGRRTQNIVQTLQPEELKQKVNQNRIQTLIDKEAVSQEAEGIIDYWRKRTIAGLLLMPATRHNLVHLNEMLKLKNRRR